MARSHLTLAALATSAVPELDVAAAQPFTANRHGEYDSALITARDGHHFLVRVPTSDQAEIAQAAELTALAALSAGVRSRLPFALSTFVGTSPVRDLNGRPRAANVYEFVYGRRVVVERMSQELAASIGRAMAALHALPASFVIDAGLPVVSAIDSLRSVVTVMDRAAATSLVPAVLLSRWETATDDTWLWQYQPTVIHGAMSADVLLHADSMDGDEIVGVLGWADLRIGDPARDLSWTLSAPYGDLVDTVFECYAAARHTTADRGIRRRAMLYAELELARWLLHGADTRDTEIVEDAVDMLESLAASLQGDVGAGLAHETGPVLDVTEVQRMLDAHPTYPFDQHPRRSLTE